MVSNANWKKRRCKSTDRFDRMQLILYMFLKLREYLFARSSEKRGRKMSRQCLHGAPSCVKISSPKRGAKVGRRAPRPYSAR